MAYTQGEMIALGFVFAILATFFVCLRVWARKICGAALAADDYAIFVGWVSCDIEKEVSMNYHLT